jgi:peptidoglycan DL-endopeptidase CwlO
MPGFRSMLTVALLLAMAALAAGCASSGAVAKAGLHPIGEAEGVAVASTALALRGAPYRNGGTTPDGFDCSGLVQYVYRLHGVSVPRETREQFRLGRKLRRDDLVPGDLVFFTTVAAGASHVGIVIGPDQFVHAPSERGVVRVERLSAEYWNRRYLGARRPHSP